MEPRQQVWRVSVRCLRGKRFAANLTWVKVAETTFTYYWLRDRHGRPALTGPPASGQRAGGRELFRCGLSSVLRLGFGTGARLALRPGTARVARLFPYQASLLCLVSAWLAGTSDDWGT